MKNKHIAVVTRYMHGGGAERVIAQLANYLVSKGNACTIVTLEEDPVRYALAESVTVTCVPERFSSKLIDRIDRYARIRKYLKSIRPGVVLTMPEEVGIYATLAMVGSGIPVVVSERNNPWIMPDVKITRMLRAPAYLFAKGLIFQTEMAKSFFPRSIQKKGIVLPNPVDASRIPTQYQGERRKVIVGAGRLHPQKNFSLLIKAFARFHRIHPEYQLVIWGDGELRSVLEEQIRDLKLKSAVFLPGRNDHLLEEIRDCAMFVLSSDYEGSPNVLIEAMCMGMPVISTDCPSGGPKELIRNGENGLLVAVGDEIALSEAMLRMTDTQFTRGQAVAAYESRKILTSSKVFENWETYLDSF